MDRVIDILGQQRVPFVEGHEHHCLKGLIKDLETLVPYAQVDVVQTVLQGVTTLQDALILLQLVPFLHVPVVLNQHLNVVRLRVELQSPRYVMILLPLVEHFEALREQCLPDPQIDFLDLVIWSFPRVVISGAILLKLLPSRDPINLSHQLTHFHRHIFFLRHVHRTLRVIVLHLKELFMRGQHLQILAFRYLPLVLSYLALVLVHLGILAFLLTIVNEEMAELLVNVFPHVVLGIGNHTAGLG